MNYHIWCLWDFFQTKIKLFTLINDWPHDVCNTPTTNRRTDQLLRKLKLAF